MRIGDRLRFALELWVLRGLGYRLLLAAVIVGIVAVVGGLLAFGVAGGFEDADDAVWWAFLRLTDPGYLGDDEGSALRAISTVVTVLGYLLFLGLLIAILTQWLNQTLQRLESGITPIALRDHVIVLGWTGRTAALVAGLLSARGRIRRFLAEHDVGELRVVILVDSVSPLVRQELRERLGDLWDDRRVLLRCGSPLRLEHLERVAFREAAALILPGADFAEGSPEAADAQVVKTLVSVSKHAHAGGDAAPRAVAEVFDARQVAIADGAYDGEAAILPTDRMVSRLIAQSVQQRGIHEVFHELFRVGVGNAIFIRPQPELAGRRFDELRGTLTNAVPIGLVRGGDHQAVLLPDPETRMADGDALVVIARSYEDCGAGAPAPSGGVAAPAAVRRLERQATRRLLILGWSRKLPALLSELRAYGPNAFEIHVLTTTPIEERQRQLARYASTAACAGLVHHEGGYTSPGPLEALDPGSFEEIVLLASERLDTAEEADATTVLAYLRLRGLLPDDSRSEIVVELLGEENRSLFADGEACVVVSPTFMSYVVSQVALRPELACVFDELTRPFGPQIFLQPAADLVPEGGRVRFGDLQRATAERGEIALGLHRGRAGGLALNPGVETAWTLGPEDQLVCLASFAEPSAT